MLLFTATIMMINAIEQKEWIDAWNVQILVLSLRQTLINAWSWIWLLLYKWMAYDYLHLTNIDSELYAHALIHNEELREIMSVFAMQGSVRHIWVDADCPGLHQALALIKQTPSEHTIWPENAENVQISPCAGFVCGFYHRLCNRYCFKFELLVVQPCWLTQSVQMKSRKGWLMM